MEVNPQLIIDELSRRIQQLTLENVVLAAQVRQLSTVEKLEEDEETVIG